MTSYKEVLNATISSLAIIIIIVLLISAVYNFNHRGRGASSHKKSSSRKKYSVLMWLYIYTGFLYLIYNSIKLYIALAPDSHITHPNMCQFYWQAYQFYIVGKLLMYLFYCNRIYQAFKGSAFETTSRNYKILVGSVSFFYVGISIAFMVEVFQWGDEDAFPLAPDIGKKSAHSSDATFETWDDCVLQTDYYVGQLSMIIKIIILYLGEATFSIILLRLYVRKVLQLVGHINFSSIEVTMNSVRTVRNTPKSAISALNVNAKSISNEVDAHKMNQNENVTEDQSRTQTVDTAINRGDTENDMNHETNSNHNGMSQQHSMATTNGTNSAPHPVPQSSTPHDVEDELSEDEPSGNSEMDDAFLQVAVKSTILVIFSILSSILTSLLFNVVGRFLLDLDCVINYFCMYLTFVFAKKWYSLICYGTHKCCWEIGVKCCFKCCMVDCCPSLKTGCHCHRHCTKHREDQEEELGAVVDSDKAPR